MVKKYQLRGALVGLSLGFFICSAYAGVALTASKIESNATVQAIGHPVSYASVVMKLNGNQVDVTSKTTQFFAGNILSVEPQGLVNTDEATMASPPNTYQWQVSDTGTSWSNIVGADKESYTIAKTDAGKFLHVIVTPMTTNDFPRAGVTITSPLPVNKVDSGVNPDDHFVVIKNKDGSKSGATVAPLVGVTASGGNTPDAADNVLNVHVYPNKDGSGTAYPDSDYEFQWLLGGVAIKGATQNTYTPRAQDQGKTLSVDVTVK